jgi:hypothetical protein
MRQSEGWWWLFPWFLDSAIVGERGGRERENIKELPSVSRRTEGTGSKRRGLRLRLGLGLGLGLGLRFGETHVVFCCLVFLLLESWGVSCPVLSCLVLSRLSLVLSCPCVFGVTSLAQPCLVLPCLVS